MARDRTKVQIVEYDVIFDNENIGYTKQDQTATELGLRYVQVDDAAQFQGIVAVSKTGAAPTLKVMMYQTQYESLLGKIAREQMYPIVDGARIAYGLGSRKIDLFPTAKQIRLHPVGVDADDYTNDIMYWLSAPDLSAVSYGGRRDAAQEVEVPFFILPDETKSLDFDYGLFGDWTAVEADPFSIYLSLDGRERAPYNHDPAISMLSGAVKQNNAYGFYKTDTTVTADIDEAGNVAATDATFDVDNISTPGSFSVGSYILVNSEVMRITAIPAQSGSTATFTVDRHIAGTTAAGHTDNDTITLLENVFVLPVTRRATWASSVTADLTVGNSNASENKGLMTWASDGASNVTAVVGATTSAIMAVTTVA